MAKPCAAHQENALRFVGIAHDTFGEKKARLIHAGLATGRIQQGRIGTDQPFITAVGTCVDVCKHLVDAAAYFKTFCVFSSKEYNPETSPLCSFLRPIELVCTSLSKPDLLTFYEVRATRLASNEAMYALRNADMLGSIKIDWGWSDQYANAFYNKNHEAIRDGVQGYESSHVMKKVVDALINDRPPRIINL
eukprot:TRINITY_DN13387_c0_g1_i1.p1 TRINITY_DN13387_c0_g1~~TRINITY_DN13387_c0_g1_i1.p1  ORF type:complete len:200 (+),score=31.58 TRINITY_DN13387_c0_g1_i1:26-601(+)